MHDVVNANKYVDPSQIDKVDLLKIPGFDLAAAERRSGYTTGEKSSDQTKEQTALDKVS